MAAKLKDGVFLGDFEAAQDVDFIMANKITRVINCAGRQVPNLWEHAGIRYLTFGWPESGSCVIFDEGNAVLDEIFRFVEDAVEHGGAVLIHSIDGRSRACFCGAVYFMLKYRWTMSKTLTYLQSKRADLQPRPGFLRHLRALDQSLQRVARASATSSADPSLRRYTDWDVELLNGLAGGVSRLGGTLVAKGTGEPLTPIAGLRAAPGSVTEDEILLSNTFLNSQPTSDRSLMMLARKTPAKATRRITWVDQSRRRGTTHTQVPRSPRSLRPTAERPPTASYSSLEAGSGWVELSPGGSVKQVGGGGGGGDESGGGGGEARLRSVLKNGKEWREQRRSRGGEDGEIKERSGSQSEDDGRAAGQSLHSSSGSGNALSMSLSSGTTPVPGSAAGALLAQTTTGVQSASQLEEMRRGSGGGGVHFQEGLETRGRSGGNGGGGGGGGVLSSTAPALRGSHSHSLTSLDHPVHHRLGDSSLHSDARGSLQWTGVSGRPRSAGSSSGGLGPGSVSGTLQPQSRTRHRPPTPSASSRRRRHPSPVPQTASSASSTLPHNPLEASGNGLGLVVGQSAAASTSGAFGSAAKPLASLRRRPQSASAASDPYRGNSAAATFSAGELRTAIARSRENTQNTQLPPRSRNPSRRGPTPPRQRHHPSSSSSSSSSSSVLPASWANAPGSAAQQRRKRPSSADLLAASARRAGTQHVPDTRIARGLSATIGPGGDGAAVLTRAGIGMRSRTTAAQQRNTAAGKTGPPPSPVQRAGRNRASSARRSRRVPSYY